MAKNISLRSKSRSGVWAVIFLAAHIPLALLMYQVSIVATAHALITFGLGLLWANKGRTERAAYAGAYIVGAEVLWRMTQAQIFWESGKYVTIAIFATALLRCRRLKQLPVPILFFVLLIPSAFLTILDLDFSEAQNQISFNLSGPLALATSVFFFSHLKLSRKQLHELFVYMMGPAVSIASITIFGTLTATELVFTKESNFITSGGYGPNQVSSILGLAALVAFLYAMDDSAGRKARLLIFGAMVIFLTQAAMTFSRGGIYNAAGAAILAILFLFNNPRLRGQLITGTVLAFVLGNYIILPRLDIFTGGKLSERFQETELTGRDTIILEDLDLWQENIFLGVGPGLAKSSRKLHYKNIAAHTEFSRLVAEHGILGLFAMLSLAVIGFRNLRDARTPKDKALVCAMLVWSCLYMLNAAMRLVAPAFAFGLASLILSDQRVLNQRTKVGVAHAYRGRMPLFPPNKGKNALAH